MIGKAPPAGWVVQVIIPAPPAVRTSAIWRPLNLLDAPSFKYFNVAIAAAGKAIEATTKHLADAEERETSLVRALSSEEIAVLGLKAGEVKPA